MNELLLTTAALAVIGAALAVMRANSPNAEETVVEHEVGHVVVIRALGGTVHSVTVNPGCTGVTEATRRTGLNNEEAVALLVSGLVAARRANERLGRPLTEKELLEQANSDLAPLRQAEELGHDLTEAVEAGTKLAEKILEENNEEFEELVERLRKEHHIEF